MFPHHASDCPRIVQGSTRCALTISIETPPYYSTVRIESDITRTNPAPEAPFQICLLYPYALLHLCLGVGQG
eukprot:27898_6